MPHIRIFRITITTLSTAAAVCGHLSALFTSATAVYGSLSALSGTLLCPATTGSSNKIAYIQTHTALGISEKHLKQSGNHSARRNIVAGNYQIIRNYILNCVKA